MQSTPFFTIITPVYNRAEIVTKTIQSVLQQNFTDFELILIDDGSSDGTLELIKSEAEKDDRIEIIALGENKGRCYARNTGLKNAKGNWICYLDSDDLYYPNHLSVMVDMINEHNSFVAFAVDQHINGLLKKYSSKKLHKNEAILKLTDFIEGNPLTANQLCHLKSLNIYWSEERIPISEDLLFLRTLTLKTAIFKKAIVTNNLIDHDQRTMNTADPSIFVKFNLKAANNFISENKLPQSIIYRIQNYTNLLCINVLLSNRLKKDALLIMKKKINFYWFTKLLFFKALIKFITK